MNKICSLNLGTALLVSSVFSPAQIVLAQSCTIPPTCESLGYDKNPSDCVDKAILKCPLDKTKIFCSNGVADGVAPDDGNNPLMVGSIAYSDGSWSTKPKSDKIPIGVIFDISGLAVALDNYTLVNYSCSNPCQSFTPTVCSGYSAGGLNLWKNPTLQQLQLMYDKKTKLDSVLSALSARPLASSKLVYGTDGSRVAYLEFDKGTIGTSFTETPIRCVIDISSINAAPPPTTPYKVGDTYYKNGIACGKIAKLDSTGKHGTVITSGAYVGTQSETSNYCINKSTCGLDWGIASPESIKNTVDSCNYFYTSAGCCQLCGGHSNRVCGISGCTSGHCEASF